ncbi:hypothetical protein GR212_15575 [Rhizobium lusitanum]|uniref:Uncharacterized protein n=1 Tax=Rhizobium lusitanum TaxID=293958 RepID=A0A6L9U8Z6_9HYPH|nr:hypothetical protein [Rhizobium lusitanum]NEI70998.1 hypothetical protein [Rhizobium lusitanum]
MSNATETKVRTLKARIRRESNPVRLSNLKIQLSTLVSELGAKHEKEQVKRFKGNAF